MSAGHETTAITLAWLLHDLSLPGNVHVQERLRSELLSLKTEEPSAEELNGLPYLEAVVREGLRLHPAVIYTVRKAFVDDVVPLRWSVTDRHGAQSHELRYAGMPLFSPIVSDVGPSFRGRQTLQRRRRDDLHNRYQS